jgi:hypothetical protein
MMNLEIERELNIERRLSGTKPKALERPLDGWVRLHCCAWQTMCLRPMSTNWMLASASSIE